MFEVDFIQERVYKEVDLQNLKSVICIFFTIKKPMKNI